MKYKLIQPVLPTSELYSARENIFAARGLQPNNIQHYLNTTDEDIISENLFFNIDKAWNILKAHLENRDKIFVVVDAD